MFKPDYSITSKMLSNIKRIDVLVAELNKKKLSRLVLAELERRALSLSAHASTSIEGNPLPLTEVKKILKNRPEHLRDSEKEVINYNQALEELNELINNKKVKFGLDIILKTQKQVTRELIAPYRNGKLRTEPVFVNNPKERKIAYLPPDFKDVKQLMVELVDYIKSNRRKIDPLILAGIFHKQFVVIHPFIDGNGRTARLITKLLLADLGINTFNLFSFENYYNRNVGKYFERVGILGNYYDIKDKIDFTSWLEYFTDGIIDELIRVRGELKNKGLSPATQLKPHHEKLLNYIKKNGFITDKEYSKLTDRAKPTRNLDFRKLIKIGLIKKQGKGMLTYYESV